MGDIAVLGLAVSTVILVGFIAIWNAAVQSRKELQHVVRLSWISLSLQHTEFTLLGCKWAAMADDHKNGEQFSLNVGGYEWPAVAKGDLAYGKPASVIGFSGDRLLVSKSEA